MMTSIRLRLIDWLQRLFDHAAEKFVQKLRRSKVHAKSALDLNKARIVGVLNSSAERQAYDAVSLARFNDHIHELNRVAAVSNFPAVSPEGQQSTALNNYLIGHFQNSPQAGNHPSLNEQWRRVDTGRKSL